MQGDLRVHLTTAKLASPVAAAQQDSVLEEGRRPILAEERLMKALVGARVALLGRE